MCRALWSCRNERNSPGIRRQNSWRFSRLLLLAFLLAPTMFRKSKEKSPQCP
jgi:hypothetical protein